MNLLESRWSAFIGYVHVAAESRVPVAGGASSATNVRVPRYSLHITVKFVHKNSTNYRDVR